MEKHLIVVSIDALVYEDLEKVTEYPILGEMLRNGARINHVKTIYPSLTHPVHASLLTGCPAGITGIYSNETFSGDPKSRRWFNSLSDLKCDTILHAAHRAGLSTAACRWPVTANGNDIIDYLIPETMSDDEQDHEDDPIGVYRKLGTPESCIPIVASALKRYGFNHDHPAYDEFQMFCSAEIIKKYKPNLLITHPGNVDYARHITGLFSEDVRKSVELAEKWLEMLWDSVREAGIEDTTDLVVLSDHGHMNISRVVCPNVFLADAGLISVGEDGDITSWSAFVTSCGLSGQVYLADSSDRELYNRTYTLLKHMAEEKIYGFTQVFTRQEVFERYGLSGDFEFVIETDGYSSFSEEWTRPSVRDFDISDYRFGHSTHGHMPEKGPQPPFLGIGPSFRKGVVLENGNILNHAPTLAKILGLSLPDAVGSAVLEILNTNE